MSAKGGQSLKISPSEKASSSLVSSLNISKGPTNVCFRFEVPRLFACCRGVVIRELTREGDVSIGDEMFVLWPLMSEGEGGDSR